LADVLQYANIYPGIRAVAPLLSLRFYFAAKLESLTTLYTFSGASLDKETRRKICSWRGWRKMSDGFMETCEKWEKGWRIARISAGCKFLFAGNSAAKLTVV